MASDPRALLWDARTSAEAVERFLHGKRYEDYSADEMLRSAVERQFEIVGEALSQLNRLAPELIARLPDARNAIAFRNVLIHGYAKVDDSIVWEAAQLNLPRLLQAIRELLAELADPADEG